tara:strand:- start:2928 stop:3029 length:102 start_codon:yes stop_codon:yes gene_type:complete
MELLTGTNPDLELFFAGCVIVLFLVGEKTAAKI